MNNESSTLPWNGQYVFFTVKDGRGNRVELGGMFVEEPFASYFQCLEGELIGRRYDPYVDVVSWKGRDELIREVDNGL